MPLFKVALTYDTKQGTGARCTLVLCADNELTAKYEAIAFVRESSQEGVKEFRGCIVTRNSSDVECIGRQPA